MARNASGVYSLVSGNPVVTGTLVASTWANTTLADVANEITDSLSRTGKGGMTAPLRGTNGAAGLPAFTYTNDVNSGSYLAATGEVRMSCGGQDQMRWLSNTIEKWDNAGAAWKRVLTVDDIAQATTTAIGTAELATDAEAITGTDTIRTITPAALKAAVDDRFPIVEAQIEDAAVTLDKMQDFLEGVILIGDNGSRPIGMYVNQDAAIPIGNGTTSVMQVLSGMVTMDNAGVVSDNRSWVSKWTGDAQDVVGLTTWGTGEYLIEDDDNNLFRLNWAGSPVVLGRVSGTCVLKTDQINSVEVDVLDRLNGREMTPSTGAVVDKNLLSIFKWE